MHMFTQVSIRGSRKQPSKPSPWLRLVLLPQKGSERAKACLRPPVSVGKQLLGDCRLAGLPGDLAMASCRRLSGKAAQGQRNKTAAPLHLQVGITHGVTIARCAEVQTFVTMTALCSLAINLANCRGYSWVSLRPQLTALQCSDPRHFAMPAEPT